MLTKTIQRFNLDVKKMGGYVYTKNNKLSSILANQLQTQMVLKLVNIKHKKVVDVGCGDGTYTQEWCRLGKPESICAFDPSVEAIKSAKKNNQNKKKVFYKVGDINTFFKKEKYDVAIVRGVLHHLYEPQNAIKKLSKIASTVILDEPNGYNFFLKIIEKFSRYHIEHKEKSYFPSIIDKWITAHGGNIIKRKFAGIVPYFCPDWMASFLNKIEPMIENIPLINRLFCSGYYVVYKNGLKN